MSIDLGKAKGYIELDTSSLQSACRDVAKELQKVDRQSELMRSELLKSQEGAKKLAGSCTSLGQSLNQVKERSKELTLQINESKNKMEIYKQGVAGLNNYIVECKNKQKDLKTELEKTVQEYDKSKSKLETLKREYSDYQKELKKAIKTYGEESDEVKKLVEDNKDLEKSFSSITAKTSEYMNKISQLEQNYTNLSEEIDNSQDKIKQFKTQINYAEKEIADLSKQIVINESRFNVLGTTLQYSGDKIKAFSQGLDSLGNALTVGVGAPLTAVGTASVKMAMDAETSFAKVSTVVDETALSYTRMKRDVTNTSNETGVAITNFNEALYQSISAGVESGNAIAFTTDMVKLAKGGFTETSNAVDVVTTILNAYGLEVKEATNISDKLITTQNLGKTTVDELSASLGRVIPSAKNVNVNFDNVATSMAVLTKNGIATAEATTYFNSMLNELGKSGTVADKTLKELTGKSFADLIASGTNMTDILALLQDEAKKSGKSLADMFGSAEASKAALTIMKNDGAEYNQILKQMESSAGATEKAFNKMNNTEFEKFNREINKLKNAGIEAGAKLLPVASKGVELIGDLAEAFSDLSPEQQEAIIKAGMFAVALGPVTKGVSGLISVTGSATKGIGKLFEKLGNTKNLNKATGSINGLASVLGGINPIAGLVTTSVLAVGAGVLFAMEQSKKAMIKADLESRFGSIKLSAEEVEDIAKRLTTNEFTMKLDATIEAKEKLEEFELSIQEAVDNMRRTEWKVNIGLELTEEEKSNYKSSVEQYISQTKQYIEQEHYTATLAIDAILTPNTESYNNIKSTVDSVYNGMNEELSKLGTELAEITNKAWEDKILSQDELDLINQKKSEIQKILDEVAQAEYEVKMDNLKADIPNDGLDADSFKNLVQESNKILKEREKEIEETTLNALVPLKMQYKDNPEEYEKQAKIIRNNAQKQLGEITLDTLELQVNTIESNYSDVISEFAPKMANNVNNVITQSADLVNMEGFFTEIENSFKGAFTNYDLDPIVKKGLEDIIKLMEPSTKQLEEVAESYRALGETPPAEITEGLQNAYRLEAMIGNVDNLWSLIAEQVANSPELERTVTEAMNNGAKIPEELSKALENNYGLVYNSTLGIFEHIDNASNSKREELNQKFKQIGIDVTTNLIEILVSMQPEIQQQTIDLLSKIAEGKSLKEEELKQLFANLGFTIPQELINQISNQKPATQQEMINLLNQFQTATDLERPKLLEKMRSLGFELNDKLVSEVKRGPMEIPQLKDATQQDKNNAVNKFIPILNSVQSHCNNNPIRLSISEPNDSWIPSILARPRSFPISEHNLFKELNDSYANDETTKWRAEERRTLSQSYSFQKQIQQNRTYNVVNKFDIDYSRLAKTICNELRENPIEVETNVTVNAPDVNITTNPQISLNGKVITNEVIESVDKHLGKAMNRKNRGW